MSLLSILRSRQGGTSRPEGLGLSLLSIALLVGVPADGRAGPREEGTPPGAEEDSSGLREPAFRPLPLGSVRPSGWLRDQLRIQANGLSGHLDEFWPDIKDSTWIGGQAEGWERVPYWLDGVVPLGVLLEDDAIKAKAARYIDYILAHQHDDGWLGPVSDGKHPAYDPWPLFVLFKALTQYQEATGDPRVIPAMTRGLRKIDEVIGRRPLGSWARFRAADLLVSIHWLYDRTGEPWLLDLAEEVHRQGFDWRAAYAEAPFRSKTRGKFDHDTHGVNTAMGLKQPGVWYRHSRDEGERHALFAMLAALDRYHGQATGIFTCDEHLAGRSPSQGTELCTVVEAMFSLETLLGILGEPALGDRLERLAFNALPAAFTPDMVAHQYVQQANQVVCKVSEDRVYVNNGPDANLFGLEPHFGCCTANLHQGWPKFASHLWMRSPDGGLAAVAYAPCTVETELEGKPVRVELETDYPFDGTLTFAVRAGGGVRFPLHLRIPGWARGASVQVGEDGPRPVPVATFHRIERDWGERTEVTLRLPMPVGLWAGYRAAVAIERGPLVYALKVGAAWKKVKDRAGLPFDDWKVHPTTPWNYALLVDRARPEDSVRFERRPVGKQPFSPEGAPVLAKVRGRLLPGWAIERNAAAPPPQSPVDAHGSPQELVLIPYGCTDLRMTEFPTSQ